jgi:hypothetical protein
VNAKRIYRLYWGGLVKTASELTLRSVCAPSEVRAKAVPMLNLVKKNKLEQLRQAWVLPRGSRGVGSLEKFQAVHAAAHAGSLDGRPDLIAPRLRAYVDSAFGQFLLTVGLSKAALCYEN